MKIALPKIGFKGAEKMDDTIAWKNSIAESSQWLRSSDDNANVIYRFDFKDETARGFQRQKGSKL